MCGFVHFGSGRKMGFFGQPECGGFATKPPGRYGLFLTRPPDVGLRTAVTTNESDLARAPCGDLTRVGGIPGMAVRQYAGRHDRHASDSAKMAVRRLEAR